MSASYTTGKSIQLMDGQMQSQVFVTLSSGKVYEDHLSHAGTIDALTTKVRALVERLEPTVPKPLLDPNIVVDLAPVPPPVVKPPTQDEIDRQQWFADYRDEQTALKLSACSSELQSRYKPEWGGLN